MQIPRSMDLLPFNKRRGCGFQVLWEVKARRLLAVKQGCFIICEEQVGMTVNSSKASGCMEV